MSWYLRSYGDGDTHCGAVAAGGEVRALCGVTFEPLTIATFQAHTTTIAFGAKALPGQPPDPAQACPACLLKLSAGSGPPRPGRPLVELRAPGGRPVPQQHPSAARAGAQKVSRWSTSR